MLNEYFIIGIIVVIVALILLLIIRLKILIFPTVKQYQKLKDPFFIKKTLSNREWMGKPITPELIKKMTLLTGIFAAISFLISLYILIDMGTNQGWATLTALGLILLYASILWGNYIQRQSKVKINRSNIAFTSIYTRIGLILFIVIVFIVSFFKNIAMKTPYFQIWIIGLAILIIFGSEIHYRKTIS